MSLGTVLHDITRHPKQCALSRIVVHVVPSSWHLETRKPWAVVTEHSEVTTKDLRVSKCVDPDGQGVKIIVILTR